MKNVKKILVRILLFALFIPVTVSAAEANGKCQITIKLSVPEGFDLPCYAWVYSVSEDKEYVLNLLKENDYREKLSASAGEFQIYQIAVIDDNINAYPFEFPRDVIEVGVNENYTLEPRLRNYEEVDETIKKYLGTRVSPSPLPTPSAVDRPTFTPTPLPTPSLEPLPINPGEEEPPSLNISIIIILVIIIIIVLIFIMAIVNAVFKKEK